MLHLKLALTSGNIIENKILMLQKSKHAWLTIITYQLVPILGECLLLDRSLSSLLTCNSFFFPFQIHTTLALWLQPHVYNLIFV